jgi:cyclase
MLKTRVIPVLLLKGKGLVKTIKFKNPKYIGDPINAVKIFNDKEVDELVFLDIEVSKKKHEPQFELIERIANEAFIPFAYGGGIKNIAIAKKILRLGAEKVILNSYALENPNLIRELAEHFGNQSIVVSLDIRQNIFGKYKLYGFSGSKRYSANVLEFASNCESLGAGEIIVNSISREGTYTGFDIELIGLISSFVNIPIVALGGAASLSDFRKAKEAGAHAVAAGSLFVYAKKNQGVLINYPKIKDLEELFN